MTSIHHHPSRLRSICILRLSSIGDVVQVLPTVRVLRDALPHAEITWVVGSHEGAIVEELPGVEIVPLPKGWPTDDASWLADRLRHRSFDVLLNMQTSLRANITSLAIPGARRIGFDRARARELHGAVITERIPESSRQHVLEGFLSFAAALGVHGTELRRCPPISEASRALARRFLPDGQRHLVINPCASHPERDWRVEGYADVAAHAMERYGMRVVLTGAPTPRERAVTRAIAARLDGPVENLVGRDDLRTLPAILERADVVVSPDTGPCHLAAAVGTPVVGLYAATNPKRSGPYGSLRWCVDRFDEAARRYRGRPAEDLPWRTRIEVPGVMNLIEPADVRRRLDELLATRDAGSRDGLPVRGSRPFAAVRRTLG